MARREKTLAPLTEAEREIVEANLGVIGKIAGRRARGDWAWRDDFFQAGIFGMVKAIRKHRPELGKLTGLLEHYAGRSMSQLVAEQAGAVTVPYVELYNYKKSDKFMTRRRALAVKALDSGPLPIAEDDPSHEDLPHDTTPVSRSLLLEEFQEQVRLALGKLRPLERRAIEAYMAADCPPRGCVHGMEGGWRAAVAVEFGVTRSGVSCARTSAIKKLRFYLREYQEGV